MKFNFRGLIAPFLIGAIAVSCEQKELEELTPNTSIASEKTQQAISANLLFEETFETSSVFSGLREQFGTSHAFNVNNSTIFNGSKSGRFELRDSDPMTSGGTRAEVLFPVQENLNRWYAFSIYLPSSEWQSDSKQDVISQWHQGGGKNPSSSLRIYKDKLRFDVRKDPSTREVIDLGAVIKDEWQTFVVHIKHSHGSDGLVEIWHNGKKVVDYAGSNSYDSSFDSPRWKLGIYKSDWNNDLTTDVKKRVLYYDEIRMGNEKATLADMMPRTGSSPIVADAPSASTSASFLTNAGGLQYKDSQSRTWSADGGFSGGVSADKSISVSNTSDDVLYSNYRYASSGKPFSYSIPVKASGSYTVKLHFVEPYFKSSNSRVFNVALEGKGVMTNYDIHSEAGFGKAVVKTFSNVSVTDGTLNIDFASLKNNAIISAIEVIPPAETNVVKLTNSGGQQFKDSQSRTWSADGGFSGGVSADRAISVSGTKDAALYTNYRYASSGKPFSYSIPVKASGSYTVKLHFVEPYFKSSNSRVFNVALEGKGVMTNYDIHSEAGFGKAVVKTFSNVSVTDGTLNIDFASLKNNAIISAVEVIQQ